GDVLGGGEERVRGDPGDRSRVGQTGTKGDGGAQLRLTPEPSGGGGNRLRSPPELLQRLEVRADGRPQRRVRVVGHAVLRRDFHENRIQGRIVHGAHLREQVVLHLEVQPADIPREQTVVGRKVGRGQHLVYGPAALDHAVAVADRLLRSLHHVRQLEYHAEDQAGREVHGQEPDRELPPRDVQHQQGDDDGVGVVDGFGEHQGDDFSAGVLLVRVGTKVGRQEILVVLDEHPEQRRKTVEGERQVLLDAVNGVPCGAGRHADERRYRDVFIHPVNVRVGVVDHVVGDLPHVPV